MQAAPISSSPCPWAPERQPCEKFLLCVPCQGRCASRACVRACVLRACVCVCFVCPYAHTRVHVRVGEGVSGTLSVLFARRLRDITIPTVINVSLNQA